MRPETREHISQAYDHCLSLARSHYENFPVASLLVPKKLRAPIAAIYAFARSADDFADEGQDDADIRLARLQAYRDQLQALSHGQTITDPIFIAIADSVARFALPLSLFDDLLSAFIQDVTTTRYATFADVLDYCHYSANPVGRLLLHLNGAVDEQNLRDSDAICTALQLINFLQDIEQDYVENNRIYIPQDALDSHGIDESWFASRRTDQAMRELIAGQIEQARLLLLQGAPLARRLQGRFGLEIRLTIAGGLRILQRLARQRDDVFSRPRLDVVDKLWMLKQALFNPPLVFNQQ
jgi:squalene synthase HpnC